ncbi:hypothetical protein ACFFJY_17365 [Fictibacillus aquaticus]|uniref:Uncharacterized protein n=1 Tax=Fictibacillus aquaticus TaxID=2021314 RepID=A0A235F6A9_9BACL|nr:hypothetical protein [Fictibacillus aquaticus]OYD56684.1 hypothetical protein CGZ90_16890 [Fictibacillus aquaticus]
MSRTTLYKLFLRDLNYSFSYGKYKYLAFYTIIAFLALMKSLQLRELESNSVGTFFALLKDEGYFYRISDYQVPFYWDFVQFLLLFLIGDFLFQDMENNRTYLLMRCRSKLHYLVSKMCWIVAQNILMILGLFLTIYMVSSVVFADFTIGASPYFERVIETQMEIKISSVELVIRIFLGYMITGILLSVMMLMGTQFVSPVITFFGIIVVCVISTFSDLKWLPAIHSMILKQQIFNMEHQLSLSFSIIYCLSLFSVVAVIALFIFQKKDIL